MKVVSLNIGSKQEVFWKGKAYTTGIFKKSVSGPVFLDKEDVEGDAVIDRKHHGGIEQAVYAYGENHYQYWKDLYPALELNYGFFGENLTLSSLDETTVHVGDIYLLGETILEATKPRQPCVKLGIRFQDAKVIKQFWNTSKSGVYFKIVQTGKVAIEDELKLVEKALNSPSIAEVFNSKK
ncbi:MOSC domain-containing protein [Lutimonas sp.]|uniref:MOSC domain-containing protein n=1 Tax=Lutimonas sp. TaxID=1872403 RepID=UPI003D9B61D9